MNVWQPPVLAHLEELLQGPWSYAEIASALSRSFGAEFTKSATIAKATRCGLADKHRPNNRQGRPRKPVYRHPVAVKPRPKHTPGKVTLLQLDNHTCRWPVEGEYPPYFFCGIQPLESLPYCAEHSRLAYTKGR
jgi:hypothetical protein